MNILITAGGTTEHIDDVRAITNTGTGRLGSIIADRLAASGRVEKIYYICSKGAVLPSCTAKAEILIADDVRALEESVKDIFSKAHIDAVIHSMAVSDYRVKTVSTADKIASVAAQKIGKQKDAAASITAETIKQTINGAPSVKEGGKVASYHDDLVIVMEKTPKIISMFRKLSPDALIIGFKLLAGVSKTELIETALALLIKNDCDYVLANDYQYLQEGRHIGHLVDKNGVYQTYDGKEAIAEAIAEAIENNWSFCAKQSEGAEST
jgi:phosphopantothenate-cysteine ligase